MALPTHMVFIIGLAVLFIEVHGQCAGERSTETCGCNNPTPTTPRTIEIVRVREPEIQPVHEPIDRRRPLPIILQPTIQKYFVFPQNSKAVGYPRPYPVGNGGGYLMMPVAVRRKVIKKSSSENSN